MFLFYGTALKIHDQSPLQPPLPDAFDGVGGFLQCRVCIVQPLWQLSLCPLCMCSWVHGSISNLTPTNRTHKRKASMYQLADLLIHAGLSFCQFRLMAAFLSLFLLQLLPLLLFCDYAGRSNAAVVALVQPQRFEQTTTRSRGVQCIVRRRSHSRTCQLLFLLLRQRRMLGGGCRKMIQFSLVDQRRSLRIHTAQEQGDTS